MMRRAFAIVAALCTLALSAPGALAQTKKFTSATTVCRGLKPSSPMVPFRHCPPRVSGTWASEKPVDKLKVCMHSKSAALNQTVGVPKCKIAAVAVKCTCKPMEALPDGDKPEPKIITDAEEAALRAGPSDSIVLNAKRPRDLDPPLTTRTYPKGAQIVYVLRNLEEIKVTRLDVIAPGEVLKVGMTTGGRPAYGRLKGYMNDSKKCGYSISARVWVLAPEEGEAVKRETEMREKLYADGHRLLWDAKNADNKNKSNGEGLPWDQAGVGMKPLDAKAWPECKTKFRPPKKKKGDEEKGDEK